MSKKFSDLVDVKSSQLIEEGRMTDNAWLAWQYGIKQGPHETRDHYNQRMILAGEYHRAFDGKKTYVNNSQVGIIDYTLGGYYKFKSVVPDNINKCFESTKPGTSRYNVPIANFDHRIDYKLDPNAQMNFFVECAKRFQPSDSKMMAYDRNRYGTTASTSVNMEGAKARIALDFSSAPDENDDSIICFDLLGNVSASDPNSFMNLSNTDRENYYNGVFSIFMDESVRVNITNAIDAIKHDVMVEKSYFSGSGLGTSPIPSYRDRSDSSIGTEATIARYMNSINPRINTASNTIKMYIESMIKQNVDRKSINTLYTWIENVTAAYTAITSPKSIEDTATKFVLAFGIPLYPTIKNDDLVNLYFNAVRTIGANQLNLTKINDDLIFVTQNDRTQLENRIRKTYPWLTSRLKMAAANAIRHPFKTYNTVKSHITNALNTIHRSAENGPLRYH